MPLNLKKRAKLCNVQIFAEKFTSFPILTRVGIKVRNVDGSYEYLNHKPKTDWNAELVKCSTSS